MNDNDKKREIQRKYREQIRKNKSMKEGGKGTYTVEAVIVIAIIVVITFLNFVFKGF
ncbi:hypothetical protein [Bacillus halotolerans]|nr:hypothetical protein [Bacillus halotolerans]MDL5613999.1 hypothetical protein [Bacillus halotolerans]MEC1408958.1 hypothetical protein [Bacillus halotolerans]